MGKLKFNYSKFEIDLPLEILILRYIEVLKQLLDFNIVSSDMRLEMKTEKKSQVVSLS